MNPFKDFLSAIRSMFKWKRSHAFELSSRTALILFYCTVTAIWLRFFTKEFPDWITSSPPAIADAINLFIWTAVGVLGLLTGFVLLFSSLWFTGNAPESDLDEREAQQRNRAYVTTARFLFYAVFIGGFIPEILQDAQVWSPSENFYPRYLISVFFTGIFVPVYELARGDITSGDAESTNQ